jgi:Stage II sporulation protein E (SpoIIE)
MPTGVRYAIARSAGGRRRYSSPFFVALVALAVAAPGANAALPDLTDQVKLPLQLPKLPVKDGVVGDLLPGETAEGVVEDVVDQPLPQPVEDVVQNSPVAPVRDEVRRVVKETTGGSGGGGGGGGSGDGGSGTGGSGSSTGGDTAGGGTAGGDTAGGRQTGTGRRGARNGGPGARRGDGGTGSQARQGGALRLARGASPGRGTVRSLSAGGGSRARARDGGAGQRDDSAPAAAIRTIETVVNAVPTFIWVALGVLSLLALGLAARTYVERRNARALAADRDQLKGDVAVLERALLPAIPDRIGSAMISVAYRSSEGPAAGGDFYDAFELPGGRAAVIVGDVSGHGPDALEGTNSVRAQLHAHLETGMTPRAAIALVGERSPVQLAGRFSTVIVAVHDPADGTLTYATAGHAPPVIVCDDADELLSAGGSPPIGVGLRTGLRETTVALPPGCTCCFYTDGIVEARNGDGMIGRPRLTELVAGLERGDQAEVLLERVLDEAHDVSDDMTLCLLRPVATAAGRPPRVEVLEFDAEEVESGFFARFLEACGVPEPDRPAAVDRARELVGATGVALLEVTLSGEVPRTRVLPAAERDTPQAAV